MENPFNLANTIVEKASELILKNHNNIRKISYKSSKSNLVTNVDHEVENLVLKEIIKKYPDHSIIAEESGKHKKNPRYKWFIDPIDGTTNFAHGYPFFCISIAFAEAGEVKFGLVKNPITDELFSAVKNKGAKLNGKNIKVSKIKTLSESLLATGFPYDKKDSRASNLKNFCKLTLLSHGVRRDGAAALDLCYTACGRVDGFWEIKLSPWDVAAGVLIVQEAGGKVTDFQGNKYDIFTDKIVSTNSLIHKELLKHLK